ncbi:hypothetical protein [Micromonospora narathiwatensis]|uniref:hypothetical protein n=1 Tax=Micromonospora narathiwatensis TaxID=299146 RepID=UPI000ADC7C0D|nr:hypothetical protein [Micromonospora narathiwatensis]
MADHGAALLDLGASEYLTVRLPAGTCCSCGSAVATAPGCDLRVVSYRLTSSRP